MDCKEGALSVIAGFAGVLLLNVVLFFLLFAAVQATPENLQALGVIIVLAYLIILFASLFAVPSAITGLVYDLRCPRRPYREAYVLGVLSSFLTALSFVLFLHFYSVSGFEGFAVVQLAILVVSFSVIGGMISAAAVFLKRFLKR